MTDEEYIFRQTERERKRDGWGTFNKKRQGGRNVRLPSDGMTKKEWAKMNGEVKTYDFSKLMSWAEFRKIPHDIQQQYLDSISDRFGGIFGAVIADGMGATPTAFAQYIHAKELTIKNNRASAGHGKAAFYASDAGRRWLAWKDGTPFEEKADEPTVIDAPTVSEIVERIAEGPSAEQTPAEQTPAEKKTASIKQADINNVAMILNALAGTGAKLTIEITL
jgi:hypothetical protein